MTNGRLPRAARGPHMPLRVPAPGTHGTRAPIGLHTIRAAFTAHIAHEHGDEWWEYQRCPTCRSYLAAEWAAVRALEHAPQPPADPTP